jgi:D-tyrosyl-tRNA(Tyr) deacylase
LQFTLYHTLKGNRPDFHLAMGAEKAPIFYDKFMARLKSEYDAAKIKGAN